MVKRLNKICLGINRGLLILKKKKENPSLCKLTRSTVGKNEGRKKKAAYITVTQPLGRGIQRPETDQKSLLFPSSEDYSTTGGKGT